MGRTVATKNCETLQDTHWWIEREMGNKRNMCKAQDVVQWARQRRRAWNNFITRMAENLIIKITRDNEPNIKTLPGRPKKYEMMDIHISGSARLKK